MGAPAWQRPLLSFQGLGLGLLKRNATKLATHLFQSIYQNVNAALNQIH